MHRKLSFMVAAAIFLAGACVASAQQDVYKVNYFSNNLYTNVGGGIGKPIGLPDGTIRIDNPGLTYGNLCAMIYVFDADQQMTECCGCVQSHNNLTTTPVPFLTLNPLTGVISQNGVIKIVSALFTGVCDPASGYVPKPNLRAWGTHVQALVNRVYPITETEFSDSTLGAAELAALQTQCDFIEILGSGHGICSCGDEVVTAAAKR